MNKVPHPVIIKEFKEHEFKCQCGNADCDYGYQDMDPQYLNKLFTARKVSPVAFVITSAVRCPRHPLAVQNPTSSHNADRDSKLLCCATDIKAPTSGHVFEIWEALRKGGITRIGWNQKLNFIHNDSDAGKVQRVIFKY